MAKVVLIADDSPTVQKRASGILAGEGLEVVTVSNGVAAVKKLDSVKPSLVLADVSMPGRDGYEVCEQVKRSPTLSTIPVVLIYSDDDPFDEGRARRAGAVGQIKKPFEPADLLGAVKRYMAKEESTEAPPAASDDETGYRPGMITEPVDAEPQIRERRGPDPTSFMGGVAFAESFAEESPPAALHNASSIADTQLERPPVNRRANPTLETVYLSATDLQELRATIEEPKPSHALPAEPFEAEHSIETPAVFHAPVEIPEPVSAEEPPGEVLTADHEPIAEASAEAFVPPTVETPSPTAAADENLTTADEDVYPAVFSPPPAPLESHAFEAEIVRETSAKATLPDVDIASHRGSEPHGLPEEPHEASADRAANSPEVETAFHADTTSRESAANFEPPLEAPHAVDAGVAASAPSAPVTKPTELDRNFVYAIVRKVVAKMSPAALPAPVLDHLAQTLGDEVLRELQNQ